MKPKPVKPGKGYAMLKRMINETEGRAQEVRQTLDELARTIKTSGPER